MHAKIITFAAGALFVLGNAVPLNNNKRDIVWVTEVETAVETVPVTTTVWVDPTPSADNKPQQNKHYGHRSHKQEQSVQTTVEVQPTPSSEPSSTPQAAAPTEPAPAPSSYEAPPAPSSEAPSSAAPAPSSPAAVEQPAAPATTEAPAPAPTSTYEAPEPSTSAAAPASYSSSSSDSGSSGSSSSNPASGQSFIGELTYFTPGMGACGHTSGEGDKMVAVSEALFDSYTTGGNPNKNPLCGQTLTIKGADGQDHKATIWDRCPGCAEADLDLPQEFFNAVTTPKGSSTPADGRAHGVEWSMD